MLGRMKELSSEGSTSSFHQFSSAAQELREAMGLGVLRLAFKHGKLVKGGRGRVLLDEMYLQDAAPFDVRISCFNRVPLTTPISSVQDNFAKRTAVLFHTLS